MSDDPPYLTGLLEEIVNVHFGNEGFCIVFVYAKSAFNPDPAHNLYSSTVKVQNCSVEIPTKNSGFQGGDYNNSELLRFSDVLTQDARGIPDGGTFGNNNAAVPPISNTFTKAMLGKYRDWIGPAVYNSTGFFDLGIEDIWSYMVFDLANLNLKADLTFDVDLSTINVGSFNGVELTVATYHQASAVGMDFNRDPFKFGPRLKVTTPKGVDFAGRFFTPQYAAGHQFREADAGSTDANTTWSFKVNKSSLAVSVTGGHGFN